MATCLTRENYIQKSNKTKLSVNAFSERNVTCTLIERRLRPVQQLFLESLSPCTVMKDCTFIRDIRVLSTVMQCGEYSNNVGDSNNYCNTVDYWI